MCSVIGMIIGNNSMVGLHVEIYKHKKVLYLNVFSWGLLLNNNGEKNTVVLNNRRHLLMISHKQRNTAEFLRRIPFLPGCRLAPPWNRAQGNSTRKKNICKQARPIDHLASILQTLQGHPQGVCKKRNFTLQGSPQA